MSIISFLHKPKALLREGYERVRSWNSVCCLPAFTFLSLQFHGSVFKVALFGQWMVVVSGPKMVDELRKRPDEEMSFIEGVEEVLIHAFHGV